MFISKRILILFLVLAGILVAGCAPRGPEVKITHSPVVAKSNEQVTFTATVVREGGGSVEVEILVNAVGVKTCSNLSTGGTCIYTGGPYSSYLNTTVSYLANAEDADGETDQKGYYYFAITDGSYNWSLPYFPARTLGTTGGKYSLLFHHDKDYPSFDDFVDDVEDKLYDVYAEQDIIESVSNFDNFNFYIYSKEAITSTVACGIVHADTDSDVSWRNQDAILHKADFGDCTSFSKDCFTAEGSNTKAFLHESGHGVFGLADEYDAAPKCNTGYFQPTDEPNIWDLEADCKAEQTAKGRDPNDCRKFTTCQGDWWGIQAANANTVMQWGMVNDPWGIEGAERMRWWFSQPLSIQQAEATSEAAEGVVLIPIRFVEDRWFLGERGVQILPCRPPTPYRFGPESGPLIRMLGPEGKEVYQRNMVLDPRVLLYEGPSEKPNILEEGEFVLRLPLLEGALIFEFYLEPLKTLEAGAPDLQIDLGEALDKYTEAGGMDQKAVCQEPQYKPDSLK